MNADVQALLQKARESLAAAELLKRESYLDFAGSRAYFAMFYAAKALLLSRGLSFSSHSAVIGAFGKEFARTGEIDPQLHRHLIDAQDLRLAGDYGAIAQLHEAQVDEILQWAREFIAAIEQRL